MECSEDFCLWRKDKVSEVEALVMARSRYLRRGHGQSVIATYAYKRYEPRMNCNNENSILRSTHNETLGTAKRKLSRARQYRLGRDTPVQPIKRREASSQVKSATCVAMTVDGLVVPCVADESKER